MADCLAGDAAARVRFQEHYGPLIYRFAGYAGRGRAEPGDFYLYLFDANRLYRRLASYKGMANLGAFLRGYALPDLFRQFESMRRRRTLDTVSLDGDCLYEPTASSAEAAGVEFDPPGGAGPAQRRFTGLFEQLAPEKQLLLKLLYIADFELAASDVQSLAQRSGRAVREVVELTERARESVRAREAARRQKVDEAESAAQWILQYERELRRAAEDLANLPPGSERAERLREEQGELERKRAWRQQQRERALDESRRATVTLRYREIAELLNMPVGSVSAQITRLRQELLRPAAQRSSSSPSPPGR